jgi:hypothetical protein
MNIGKTAFKQILPIPEVPQYLTPETLFSVHQGSASLSDTGPYPVLTGCVSFVHTK